ncbi:hypothetical protein DFO67_12430 [Modicisalibacter xianhensis]|uniref:Uncharacterized protein n=1 Tax=Modicisalibacter xianhensis TaxID=442341 RepID=A0A4V3GSQ2_9GAMM|nr:hypothetical protein [Halomonas xianhensis]TDX23713.1 hypothetical protein DFO67_12430 [Halomonas xianhensis]
MGDSVSTRILSEYDKALANAYLQYLNEIKQAGRNDKGEMDPLLMIGGSMLLDIKRAVGRLGAAVAAASKRAKRELIFSALEDAKERGHDISPTVALHAAQRLLGRGVSMRSATARFGIPRRTAADKSPTTATDLTALEARLQARLDQLDMHMQDTRKSHQLQWQVSEERRLLIEEWRIVMLWVTGEKVIELQNQKI